MNISPPVSPRKSLPTSPYSSPHLQSRPSTAATLQTNHEERNKRLHNISQTWLGMQSMLARINQLLSEEMVNSIDTQKINENRIDMLEKDLNMLRGHLNKANRHLDALVAKEAKRSLEEQDKV